MNKLSGVAFFCKLLFVSVGLIFFLCPIKAQQEGIRGDYRIMFYNVENLFDTKDDSLTVDDDFTPEGRFHWTYHKYQKKLNRIAQVIMSVGGWEVPEIVGLCEIENLQVLKDLTQKTYLSRFDYKIVHFESPDRRGIDVALLFQEDKLKLLTKEPLYVDLGKEKEETTRDILYVKGITNTQDTLHLFVNHWPSKYGGALETIPKRNAAAKTLKMKTDSILMADNYAKIIIMGDLNTEAERIPVVKTLGAKVKWETIEENGLYNLSARWNKISNYGSHKYHGVWASIDHFIVSKGMLKGRGFLFTTEKDAKVYKADFLLETDKEGGVKPFRTHIGMKYHDGFSDHLPIYLDLWRD